MASGRSALHSWSQKTHFTLSISLLHEWDSCHTKTPDWPGQLNGTFHVRCYRLLCVCVERNLHFYCARVLPYVVSFNPHEHLLQSKIQKILTSCYTIIPNSAIPIVLLLPVINYVSFPQNCHGFLYIAFTSWRTYGYLQVLSHLRWVLSSLARSGVSESGLLRVNVSDNCFLSSSPNHQLK